MIVEQLSLVDFRNYAVADVTLHRRSESVRRPQRPGQDEPRRGDRATWRRSDRTASRRTRRWCATERMPRSSAHGSHTTSAGAPRGAAQPPGVEPGAREPRAGQAGGAAALCARSCCSRRKICRSCAATRRRAADSCDQLLVQRTPRLAGSARRLRPRAAAAQQRC